MACFELVVSVKGMFHCKAWDLLNTCKNIHFILPAIHAEVHSCILSLSIKIPESKMFVLCKELLTDTAQVGEVIKTLSFFSLPSCVMVTQKRFGKLLTG